MAIHLFNPLWDASGGSEWRTVTLFEELSQHTDVTLWSEFAPDPLFVRSYPVRHMQSSPGRPESGTFVFVGAYWRPGRWLQEVRPERVILTYNVLDRVTLEVAIKRLESATQQPVELRFASALAARFAGGRPGTIELSPINLERFRPTPRGSRPAVVVGRHSRDVPEKHHPDDPALYGALAAKGISVLIMGATCLGLADIEGVEALPAKSLPAEVFLRQIDVFFYRTHPRLTDACARVVVEAMLCGLPCVVAEGAGHESLIENGRNGFLFSTEAEAMQLLQRLAVDVRLRREVGAEASKTVSALYSEERKRNLEFYLSR